ncbi:MAG: hypothetical protein LW715_00875 [Rhodobacter sp.]|jgi:hypothetical protein|nr:hypothetical protein [Rhodobacter sp.]
MKFVELGKHLRKLRHEATGRSPLAAMSAMEVWQAAIRCPDNGISTIYYNETRLPAPLLGTFVRLRGPQKGADIAYIYVHRPHHQSPKRRLAPHWKEFVIIKELMHCWSPEATYTDTSAKAAELLTTLNTPSGPFGAMAVADYMALLAAAEVIMPCDLIQEKLAAGKDANQLAHEQGLHPEVMAYICRHDILGQRVNGSL